MTTKLPSIREEFGKFIKQGNLVQVSVAFVMGLAASTLITALVADIGTPLLGVVLKVNFSTWSYTVNGSTIMQGAFLNALISFLIVLVVVFFLVALPYQRWLDRQAAKKAAAPATTRACPECLSQIPLAAHRCSFCTSVVTPAAAPTPSS